MFSPETPPPSKYRHVTPASPKKEADTTWLKRTLQVLFIIAGIGAIVGIVVMSPKQKQLVCDKSMQARGSFMGFGSCKRE